MANNNGIIYIDTSSNPDIGISIEDIQTVLDRSENDLGLLCSDQEWYNGNLRRANVINPWAKFKPFRSSALNPSATQRQEAHYGMNISRTNGRVADDLGSPSSSGSFLGKLVAGQLAWEYLPPRGLNGGGTGAHEWFRILDFDGYDHQAICPVGDVEPTSVFVSGSGTIAWDLPELSEGNLHLSDIVIDGTDLSEFYLGVLLYKTDSNFRIATSSTKLGTGDVQILLSGVGPDDMTTWKAYPFFSSVPISYNGQTGTGVYVSAGWTTYEEITFRTSSSYFSFEVYAEWNAAFTEITYQIVATNELSTQQTLENVTLHLRKNQDPSTPPTNGNDETQVSVGTIVVPAASGGVPEIYQTEPATISYNASDHETYFYWIGASATGRPATFLPIEETEPEEDPE